MLLGGAEVPTEDRPARSVASDLSESKRNAWRAIGKPDWF